MIKCVTSLLELCNYIVVLQKYHETHPFSSFPQESIKQKCEVVFRGIGKIIEGFENGGGGSWLFKTPDTQGSDSVGGTKIWVFVTQASQSHVMSVLCKNLLSHKRVGVALQTTFETL